MVLHQRQDVFRRQRHDRQNDHCGEHSVGVECALGRGDQQADTVPGFESPTTAPTRANPKLTCKLARIQLMAAEITTVVVTCQPEVSRISAFGIDVIVQAARHFPCRS
jgi:hypothetical protein